MHLDSLSEIQKEWHASIKSYVIGFTACFILTGVAFLLTAKKLLSGNALILVLIALALLQAIFQIIYFLQVGQEDKPQWESLLFYFMALIAFVIVLGSLWIMFNLNDRVMPFMKKHSHQEKVEVKEIIHD
jgi:cytochrome o ubiquinol oxidase subunit IV